MSIFDKANSAALKHLPGLLEQWLPGGSYQGTEYVVRNPTRSDSHPGSFCINSKTGKWADFATGDRGSDAVSLHAYLSGKSQYQAARSLSRMLGVSRV